MNPKHVAPLVAAVLLLAVGFLAGLFVHGGGAPADASRQELMKRLVTTKSAMEAGLALARLGDEETQLRAAAELADKQLNDGERKVVADAILGIHGTRSALQEINNTCKSDSGYLAINLYHCGEKLDPIIKSLGLTKDLTLLELPPAGLLQMILVGNDDLLSLLISNCRLKIQAAIDVLSAR